MPTAVAGQRVAVQTACRGAERGIGQVVTSRDVAREAGVSQSTVSYAMSGRRPLSEDTLRRIVEAMERLGYQPNWRARALAGKHSDILGLVIPFAPRIEHASLLEFIEAIAAGARSHGYDILLVTADEGAAGLKRVVGEQICDGLILMQIETDDERIPVVRALNVPAVLIGVPGDPHGLTCIDADYWLGGQKCVDFFVEHGHRHVSMIRWEPELIERRINFVDRFTSGVEEAARRHGITLDLLEGGPDRNVIARAVAKGIAASPECPAFIVPETSVQEIVQQELWAARRRPGLDVSLIGACAEELAVRQIVPLTTIDFAPAVVSGRAVELLVDQLNDEANHQGETQLVEPTIHVRDSTMIDRARAPRTQLESP